MMFLTIIPYASPASRMTSYSGRYDGATIDLFIFLQIAANDLFARSKWLDGLCCLYHPPVILRCSLRWFTDSHLLERSRDLTRVHGSQHTLNRKTHQHL